MASKLTRIEEKISKLLDDLDEAITDLIVEVKAKETPVTLCFTQMVRNAGHLLHDTVVDVVDVLDKKK